MLMFGEDFERLIPFILDLRRSIEKLCTLRNSRPRQIVPFSFDFRVFYSPRKTVRCTDDVAFLKHRTDAVSALRGF